MAAAQGYIGRNPADSSTVIARQSFSPTGIQTDFTFAAGYDVGYVDLYLNGARLVEGQDFTATNGSTVGLTTNAVNGDVLEVVAFKAFNATSVSAAAGNFTVGGTLDVTGASTLSGNTTVGTGITLDTNGNVNVSGVLTANSFVGDGTQLTGVGGGSVISGITIREEGSVVGTSGTVVNVNFVGPDVTATAQAGFSTITIAAGGKFINFTDGGSTGITTTAKTKIQNDFKVTGVSTFSGNVGINTDIAHHLLTIENAAGAGVANTAILLRNPTTVNDSRIGIDFAVNANAYGGSVWDGASIYVANGGVAGVGSIMTATVESGISSTRTYISHEGKIFVDRETWGSDPTSGGHPGLDINTRTTTGNGDTTYATGIDFRVENVVKKRLAVTKGDGSEGGGDWIFYRDGGSNEALRITSDGKVGIASDNPQKTLDIGGDVKILDNSPRLEFHDANSSDLANVTGGFEGYDKSGNRAIFVGAGMGVGGNVLEFGTNNILRLLIDSNGHLGINTVPSSWESGADTSVLQIDGASVACINDTDFFATSNAYWDGSNWEYIQTGEAVSYYQHNDDRKHVFRSAASGSPGGTVTWTNQLVIDVAGNVDITGISTATQFDATSDIALKENIEVIDEPITKISELKGVTFDWKKGGHSVGVIAQDVEKVLPTAVGGSKDQKTVNYNAIIGLLVESVKDQQKQIEELKSLLDK